MSKQNQVRPYHNSEHLTYNCQYHVVFCPKYRRRILSDAIAERMKELFREIADKYSFAILEMEVMPDHVHLLLDCNPRFGVTKCITKLKGISSRTLRGEFPEIDRRLPTLWTRSAFISSLGAVSLETVKQYIENQKKA